MLEFREEAELEALWKLSHVACARVSKEGRFLAINQYLYTSFEYTENELRGKHVDEVTDAEYKGKGVVELARVIAGEIPIFRQIKVYRTKTGKAIKACTDSYPIRDEKGEIEYFFSVLLLGINGSAGATQLAIMQKELDILKKITTSILGKPETLQVGQFSQDNQTNISGNSNQVSANKGSQMPQSVVWMIVAVISLLVGAVTYIMYAAKTDNPDKPDQVDIPIMEEAQ